MSMVVLVLMLVVLSLVMVVVSTVDHVCKLSVTDKTDSQSLPVVALIECQKGLKFSKVTHVLRWQ